MKAWRVMHYTYPIAKFLKSLKDARQCHMMCSEFWLARRIQYNRVLYLKSVRHPDGSLDSGKPTALLQLLL
jgi:hypothetical protein